MYEKSMDELKNLIDIGMSVQVMVHDGQVMGVYDACVVEIGPKSIYYRLINSPNRCDFLQFGHMLTVLYFVNTSCFRYTGEVVSIDQPDAGCFELRDGIAEEVISNRRRVRVESDISCECLTARPEGNGSIEGSIRDLDLGGAAFISDTFLEPGSQVRLRFRLPNMALPEFDIEAGVIYTRPILIKGRKKYRIGMQFRTLRDGDSLGVSSWVRQCRERDSVTEASRRSADPSVRFVMMSARSDSVETMWDRAEKMQPQCAFGELGVCCHTCLQGPCRIDPFGEGSKAGICGASASTMIAKNFARMVAVGTSAHVEHARHLSEVLMKLGNQKLSAYKITDENKLRYLVKRLGGSDSKTTLMQLTAKLAEMVLDQFIPLRKNQSGNWLDYVLPAKRQNKLDKLGVLPSDLYSPIVELAHRSSSGVDTNPKSLLLSAMRCAMADLAGMHIATEVSDILFGTPAPIETMAGLSVIRADAVNLAVHGHNPMVGDVICDEARKMNPMAVRAGAPGGINVIGVCCAGNELLLRHGIPLAANFASQELAIQTGALDAVAVDYQCISPGIAEAAACYHTRIFTTMPVGRLPENKNVEHIEFDLKKPEKQAQKIIKAAIASFHNRKPERIMLPAEGQRALVGFSMEAIVSALSNLNAKDPLQPLLDQLAAGNIQGIALLGGCNNVLVRQDHSILTLARTLIQENVLVVTTGCSAGACAKSGLLTGQAALKTAGGKLRSVLQTLGEAGGIDGPLPPVLHMGSCVNNARAVDVACALASRLGVDMDEIPVVVSIPEPTTEKAVSIALSAVTLGFPVHVGMVLPIMGSALFESMLKEEIGQWVGGHMIIDSNPISAAGNLLAQIRSRRKKLGLSC